VEHVVGPQWGSGGRGFKSRRPDFGRAENAISSKRAQPRSYTGVNGAAVRPITRLRLGDAAMSQFSTAPRAPYEALLSRAPRQFARCLPVESRVVSNARSPPSERLQTTQNVSLHECTVVLEPADPAEPIRSTVLGVAFVSKLYAVNASNGRPAVQTNFEAVVSNYKIYQDTSSPSSGRRSRAITRSDGF
jgi:hypothetical protein